MFHDHEKYTTPNPTVLARISNSPKICLDETVNCHEQVVSVLLRPLLGNGEDGAIDILGVGHDVIGSRWSLHDSLSHGFLTIDASMLWSLVTIHLDRLVHLLVGACFNQHLAMFLSLAYERLTDCSKCLILTFKLSWNLSMFVSSLVLLVWLPCVYCPG